MIEHSMRNCIPVRPTDGMAGWEQGESKGRDLILVFLLFYFGCFFCFPSWLLKCCNLQHFLAKCTYFTRPSRSSASFSTSPACPANIASITSKFASHGKSEDSIKGAGGLGGAAAPLGGAAAPMMIEKLGAKNLKSNGRMMIEIRGKK